MTKRDFHLASTLPKGSILDELTDSAPAPARRAATPPPAAEPPAAAAAPLPAPATIPSARQPARPQADRATRTPIRVNVPPALADRVRAAVAALQYRVPEWESLNIATTAALERLVTEAEQAYNGGEPFPWQRGGHLRPGRRVGQQ